MQNAAYNENKISGSGGMYRRAEEERIKYMDLDASIFHLND